MKPIHKSLVWLRNDLRLHDNESISIAAEKSQFVTVLYCFDTDCYRKTQLGLPKTGFHRTKFLFETLKDLDKNLKKIGGELLIKVGKPEAIMPKLCNAYGFSHGKIL